MGYHKPISAITLEPQFFQRFNFSYIVISSDPWYLYGPLMHTFEVFVIIIY